MSQDTRKDRRAKIVSLNVRYKSATVDEFIENHSHDVSKGGLFIKTPTPFPPGTLLKFEIRIASDKAVIAGVGRVVWKREPTQAGNERPAGMGVKFIKVDDSSRATIDRVVGTGGASGGSNFESEPAEEKPSIPVSTTAGPSKPPLVRRATMAGLGVGSIPPESLSASHPPPATITSSGAPAGPPAPGTAAAAAALKAMPTVPRPMFPGQLQSLLHEEPVKEPTMMKQAAELLEEALKEAGGSMADIGDNPLFNRPSRRPPRPGSVAPTAANAATNSAPTTPPPPGIEDALSATRTLADEPVASRRGITTTAIGLPPPPGLRLGGSAPPAAASGVTPPTPPTPADDESAADAPQPKSTRSTAPPPLPAASPDTALELLVSESDIAALPSDSKVPALRVPTPVLPVSARAQLGSRGDAERRSGGGGLIWAGLGVVVVFGLFGVYKMGFFGGGEPPAPSATPADTSAPSASAAMSAAPSASMSASASASASGGASAMPSASATSTTSAAATAKSTAAAATTAATTATPAHTTAIPVFHKRPKPTPAEDDTTPDMPATTAATSTSAAATATATSTAAPTATATSAPTSTTTATAAPTITPTATSTAAPPATSTAAPTATMRRTIGTAAPTATSTDSP